MNGKIICLLVVNLIFVWGGVYGSNGFDEVVKDLMEKKTQRLDALKHKTDPNEPFRATAEAYAKKFKHFLHKFNNGNKAVLHPFEELDFFAWEGHYLTKVYLNEHLRKEISLHGTPFQKVHSDTIDMKNRCAINRIDSEFTNFTTYILVHSVANIEYNMETIRVLFTEALLVLEDSKDSTFKEFEVTLVYFYQILKRLKWAEVVHQDPFILEGYTKLKNKHFHGVECSEQTTSCFFCHKGGVTGYVKDKLKIIKQQLKGDQESKNKEFNEISKEFKNLYYIIFENAPETFEINKIQQRFDEYLKSYFPKMDSNVDFKIVGNGQVMLNKLFCENPLELYRLPKYPPPPASRVFN